MTGAMATMLDFDEDVVIFTLMDCKAVGIQLSTLPYICPGR